MYWWCQGWKEIEVKIIGMIAPKKGHTWSWIGKPLITLAIGFRDCFWTPVSGNTSNTGEEPFVSAGVLDFEGGDGFDGAST